MEDVLRFLKTNELWIYLALTLAGIVVVRRLFAVWQEWKDTVFGLEREHAQRKIGSALTILTLLILFGVAEFIMTSVVFPDYPNVQALATPTLDLLVTPTITLAVAPLPTATPEGQLPELEVVAEGGCVPGQIEWTFPTSGETISGEVVLTGTVSVPNLGFYKFEYGQPGTNTWTTIAAGDQPLTDQSLGGEDSGRWDTEQLVPGDYLLRLVVTDNVNNVFPACVIPVRIVAP